MTPIPVSTWKRGEDATVAVVTCVDEHGDPVDLSQNDYAIRWQLRPTEPSSEVVEVVFDLTEPGAEDGRIVGFVGRDVTITMRPGSWVSDIRVIDLGSDKALVSSTFEVLVRPEVTRE